MCLFFLQGKMGMPGFPGINGIPVRILYLFFFFQIFRKVSWKCSKTLSFLKFNCIIKIIFRLVLSVNECYLLVGYPWTPWTQRTCWYGWMQWNTGNYIDIIYVPQYSNSAYTFKNISIQTNQQKVLWLYISSKFPTNTSISTQKVP